MSFHIIYLNMQGKAQMKLDMQKQCFLPGRQPMREKEIEEVTLCFFFFFLSAIIHNLGAAKCIEKLCKQFRALRALLDKIRCWCYSVIG